MKSRIFHKNDEDKLVLLGERKSVNEIGCIRLLSIFE